MSSVADLNSTGLAQLLSFKGVPVNNLMIPLQMPGMRIRVTTREGQKYIFEIVDPKEKLAHVVRCGKGNRMNRYLGEYTVSALFNLAEPIECASGSAYETISFLSRIERLDPVID
ncbi:MAG: hypothetical protein WAV50_03005 [Minisyncoccia bacterium]